MYLAQYKQARFPAALARRAAIEKAISITKSAGLSMIEATGKLIDTKRVQAAQAAAAAARSALS